MIIRYTELFSIIKKYSKYHVYRNLYVEIGYYIVRCLRKNGPKFTLFLFFLSRFYPTFLWSVTSVLQYHLIWSLTLFTHTSSALISLLISHLITSFWSSSSFTFFNVYFHNCSYVYRFLFSHNITKLFQHILSHLIHNQCHSYTSFCIFNLYPISLVRPLTTFILSSSSETVTVALVWISRNNSGKSWARTWASESFTCATTMLRWPWGSY